MASKKESKKQKEIQTRLTKYMNLRIIEKVQHKGIIAKKVSGQVHKVEIAFSTTGNKSPYLLI